ncbi:MAG: FAD-dependent oxidoreductase [Aromatoleum sp.]|jgi:NADPH-dependent 2,4-dienoyl-CoA reductase/sulfur reductase-like enzyme|uniref:NAD(P)/FAD-dependent oxidoreductase n=1 Tax=Aromatoleum sp. TaxID=2307007 RepID=UPI002894A1CE|nr:FAD-dependent oxidoreductase [Aromatoleum sp.]MDT3671250.1 FAD-dependent oxidoreductase [Aromatoleum sp.]
MSGPKNVVLIGGGLASLAAIETLRAEGYDGAIRLVSDEAEIPYDRPPLSKAYLSGETPLGGILLHDEAWYESMRVDLELGRKVEAIDPSARQVRIAGGQALGYDRVLIGTGARARELPVSVVAPEVPVHYIRTRADSDRLRESVKAGARVVLIGGGVIGMEAAATLVQLGCDVTVLEAGERIMARFFPPALSEMLAEVHAARGVKLHARVVIESVSRQGDESVVTLGDGTTLAADIVIVGIGSVPNAELAVDAGLELRYGGIMVDVRAQTAADGVYAAGDVATFQLPDGRWARWENWTHARLHGAHSARHMLGKGQTYAELPWVWSDQYDLNLQVLGSPESSDPPAIRGSLEAGRVTAFHLDGGRLVGATMINDARNKSSIRKLLERGDAVSPEQLVDPSVDLKKLAASA